MHGMHTYIYPYIHTYLRSAFGQLNTQATTRRCFTNTTFPSDEDPLKALLIDYILQRWLRKIHVVNINQICHDAECKKVTVYTKFKSSNEKVNVMVQRGIQLLCNGNPVGNPDLFIFCHVCNIVSTFRFCFFVVVVVVLLKITTHNLKLINLNL